VLHDKALKINPKYSGDYQNRVATSKVLITSKSAL
jgi:hypothetical protein